MIIAIVGPDGIGKTTQTRMLANRLKTLDVETATVRPVLWLQKKIMGREMSFTRASPRLMRVKTMQPIDPVRAFYRSGIMPIVGYLYALVSVICIRSLVGRRRVVVCDRYFYQFFYDLFGKRGIVVSRYFPKPDLAFYLRSSPETFRIRQKASDRRLPEKYFEALLFFLEEVADRDGLVKIDASEDAYVINNLIYQHLVERVGPKSKKAYDST